jgi:arylsulfatase A-like enzyme
MTIKSVVIFFLLGFLVLAVQRPSVAADQAVRPNLIYILLDDAGYGDLSCYGQQRFETPNIDKLAAQGMRFTQHYSGSTVCAPTRCCLMTGVHTGHAYVRGNREVKPEGQAPLPADIVTIPRLLKGSGYVTGAFGKWGLGSPGSASDPAEHFDRFFGYNCQALAHTYYPDHLWDNRQRIEQDGKTHSAKVIMDAALEFVRSNKDEPFFVYLPVTIPHAAMHSTAEYAAPFRKKFSQFENKIGSYANTTVRNPIAAFAGMMTEVDDHVGQLMALLRELSIDDNTLVMLSSDNGPHQEGGHDPEFFDSNGSLRGHKRDLYDGGVRAPLIARWPGRIAPGTQSDLACAQWDMLPTFCELVGIDPPAEIDGISIVPELTGHSDRQPKHDYLYWEFYEQGGKRAVRVDDWKAIQLNVHKNPNGPIEIYDLSSDIGERNNIATSHPERVDQAKLIFSQAHQPSAHWTFGKANRSKSNNRKAKAPAQ